MKEKLNIRRTMLIGLGFFAVSISWSIYNAYVPLMLEDFITNTFWLGLIMAIDNIFGVIFQPMFGRLSDRTRTRFGRRMPFIIIGAPLAALVFTLIPFTGALWSLMAVVITFNLIMSAWRSPVVALMPDLTPPALRSQGNGIINLWGGIGSVIAFLVGGILFNIGGMTMPFLVSGVIMVIAAAILFITVKEGNILIQMGVYQTEPVKTEAVMVSRRDVVSHLDKGEKRSLILILSAIFFWFCGYNAIETFFTLYATNTFPALTDGDASMMLTFFSLSFLVMAVPAGYIAGAIGRKRSIIIGLIVDVVTFIALFLVKDLLTIKILMAVGGIFWAMVNINSLPMVVEMAGIKTIGAFTGYYYAFSQSAAILSPMLIGLIHNATKNYASVFPYAAIFFVLALLAVITVRHGEAKPSVTATDVLAGLDD